MQFSSIRLGYTKRQIIQYYLSEGSFCPDGFVMPIDSDTNEYKLVYNTSEIELERAVNAGKIKDFIIFQHILEVISCNYDFLSEGQLVEIESGIGNKK
jgi:hypothetical protein